MVQILVFIANQRYLLWHAARTAKNDNVRTPLLFSAFVFEGTLSALPGAVLLCWPYEFPGYRLQSTTNLLKPITWTDVPLTSSNLIILNSSVLPQDYFQVIKP